MTVQWRIVASDTSDLGARRRGGSAERLAKRLREHGIVAPGEILSVRPSLTGKAELVMKLQVRVRPRGSAEFDGAEFDGAEFELELAVRMDELGWFRAGQSVQVRYDPADHRQAIIEHPLEQPELTERFGS